MNSVKMSYGGFTFNANPSSIKTELSKEIVSAVIPFKKSKTGVISKKPATVSGSGSFCGSGAREQAQRLLAVYKKEGADYLFTPVSEPVKAFFTSLVFSVNADKERIDYTFTFTQEESAEKGVCDFGYTVAEKGENLFDISFRTETPLERIVDLNGFKNPFCVREGDRVWLK